MEADEEGSADESDITSIRHDRLYEQLLLHCGGQLLAVIFILLVWGAWTLLQDYRDAILWAVVCSVTLRDMKEHLTAHVLQSLETDRSLLGVGVSTLCLPFSMLNCTLKEVIGFLKRWRRYAFAYEEQRRLTADRKSTDERPLTEPKFTDHDAKKAEDHTAAKRAHSLRQQTKSFKRRRRRSNLLGVFAGMFEIGQLGVKAYQGGKTQGPLRPRKVSEDVDSQSPPLLSGLLIAIALYQAFYCVQSSWSSFLQILALSSTAVLSLVLLPFCYLVGHLYLPSSTAGAKSSEEQVQVVNSEAYMETSPDISAKQGIDLARRSKWRQTFIGRKHRKLDGYAKRWIAGSVHSLVAAGLVVALVLSLSCVTIFMSVQIGQESTAAVRAVHEAARDWATIDVQSAKPKASHGAIGKWVVEQQASMGQMLQENLPVAAEWTESQINALVEMYNLTQVRDDMKALYTSVMPTKVCTEEQRRQFLVALARAKVNAQKASNAHDEISQRMSRVKESLDKQIDGMEEGQTGEVPQTYFGQSLGDYELAVVQLSNELTSLQKRHLPAHSKMEETVEKVKVTQENLDRCRKLQQGSPDKGGHDSLQQLGSQLQTAYEHLWELRLQDGLNALQGVIAQAVNVSSDVINGKSQFGLNTLQRTARLAAEPLIILSRTAGTFLASSTYSTTLLALTSGMGVFRLGLGILKSAVQMIVFLALLFYLLAAESDPVAAVFQILPLSKAVRLRVSQSIEQSMRGILVAACKLALFHALFTWLTFRIFDVHLVYLSALASAVFACIPFIPSWLVALPATAQLVFIQDRPAAAIILLTSHFFAWYLADEIILREIPSTHPYITGLGIFGGIATFSNPLQGAVFGPMALSVLSLAYNLHFSPLEDENVSTRPSLHSLQSIY